MFGYQAMEALQAQIAADRRRLREGEARSHALRRRALRARRWPWVRSPLADLDLPTATAGPAPAAPAVPAVPAPTAARTFAPTASD